MASGFHGGLAWGILFFFFFFFWSGLVWPWFHRFGLWYSLDGNGMGGTGWAIRETAFS